MKKIDGITFKSYALKGQWKVCLHGHVIGFVAKPWCNLPYKRLLLGGEWSNETYKNRMEAVEDILSDLGDSRKQSCL
jgi:hypothetical protein|tara:strand:+ start:3410 stop:3640 length:231 start_codon:yes stop_codon:yes gene_type:complete